ncbi:MAG: hypothetical protein QOK90_08990 [Nitrososphaeraceae archaeon]|jgi:hypothetical protein|nr:hypothetical protein [Nitrososphaeraceae archaeon]
MEKIRTNSLFSSEFDFLQPRTSTNLFLIQNKNTIDKKEEEERKNDIQFDIVLDTILSNLNLIKNQIKS